MQIQDRTLEFGVKILNFADKLPRTVAGGVIVKQLIRSGTSIGANMEEADGAASKKDFINKVIISRKEARETRYWLQLIKQADLIHGESNNLELEKLTNEIYEIIKILSSIINKAKEKSGYHDI
ncbi:MAG: four helix bundle protein [Candidatus Margulisbacteria bacterium]|nr:four helix bundle protein [Candidatus Margulisiibacteriota bacterium]